MRSKRIEKIRDYIYLNKTVTLDRICEQFDISKSTLRRDLEEILQSGDIKKIYGGVTVLPQRQLISFKERNIANPEAKRKIASAAADLVKEGDIIFLDSGTTTLPVIDFITKKKRVTILTNNVEIILRAIPYENINIISLSGTLSRKTLSFTGATAEQVLQHYNISKAFMATTGFSVSNGVTNSSPVESEIKRTAVQRSQHVYLLADSSKFNAVSLVTYCDLNQIDLLITEKEPTSDIRDYLEQNGKQILIAQ
jgi:DeoR family myo-inositol catabolism operon transcriptional repressor